MAKKIRSSKEIFKQIIKKLSNMTVHSVEIFKDFCNFLKRIGINFSKEFKVFLHESSDSVDAFVEDLKQDYVNIYEEEKSEYHKFIKMRKDPKDDRDIKFSDRHAMAAMLPSKIDLRELYNNKIENQGMIGSCTGQGGTSMMEFVNTHINKKPPVELSAMYLYYKERELEGTVNIDNGAVVRNAMKVLQKHGVCRDELWPYEPSKLFIKPNKQCDEDAKNYTIKGYQRVSTVNEVKNCIKIHHPVLIGMRLYESFDTKMTAKNGMIPFPNVRTEQSLGSHCMLIVGYDDNKNGGSFIVQNSWGSKWGDNGYCYVKYSMFNYIHDCWTLIEHDNAATGILDMIMMFMRK